MSMTHASCMIFFLIFVKLRKWFREYLYQPRVVFCVASIMQLFQFEKFNVFVTKASSEVFSHSLLLMQLFQVLWLMPQCCPKIVINLKGIYIFQFNFMTVGQVTQCSQWPSMFECFSSKHAGFFIHPFSEPSGEVWHKRLNADLHKCI